MWLAAEPIHTPWRRASYPSGKVFVFQRGRWDKSPNNHNRRWSVFVRFTVSAKSCRSSGGGGKLEKRKTCGAGCLSLDLWIRIGRIRKCASGGEALPWWKGLHHLGYGNQKAEKVLGEPLSGVHCHVLLLPLLFGEAQRKKRGHGYLASASGSRKVQRAGHSVWQ